MLGGIFNSFIAPFMFSSIYEYPLMIVFALMLNPIHKRVKLYLKKNLTKVIFCSYILTFFVVAYYNSSQFGNPLLVSILIATILLAGFIFFKRKPIYFPLFGLLIVSCTAPEKQQGHAAQLLHQSRNFYGVLSVIQNKNIIVGNQVEILHEIFSGTTQHGSQLNSNSNLQCVPNGYYSEKGPLGDIFSSYSTVNSNWQVGVVGLGAGEMAGYAKKSQIWTFFELNPAVVEIATNPEFFTFLKECINHYDVQLGDARITLKKQQNHFDLLVIDAFTSDSIPTHLLTKEAIELYFSRLKSDGLLVFHISNRYLDLKKVLSNHAQNLGLIALIKEFRPQQNIPLVYRSDWFILARNKDILKPLLSDKSASNWQFPSQHPNIVAWTDDFTSIMTAWK
ncbi:spermidine synthase [Methyloprofundus sedimenti]|nr:fused MFS/spermidine synthase [Methyloprofundus sedimenti]